MIRGWHWLIVLLLTGCNLVAAPTQPAPAQSLAILLSTATPNTSNRQLAVVLANEINDPVVEQVRAIYATGQALGKRDAVFSKVGDSITVSRHYLAPLGLGLYDLGTHDYLSATVERYSQHNARNGNSFSNVSLAAGEGWAAWGVLNPAFADSSLCNAGETPLACEYRVVRPSIALILFGTNDVGYRTPQEFRNDMTNIIRVSVEQGVIPVISTIPHRRDHQRQVQGFNAILHELAETYHLPLIDYYALTVTLPNAGLSSDGVHPSAPPGELRGAATFTDQSLRYGYTVRNLAALQALMVIDYLVQ